MRRKCYLHGRHSSCFRRSYVTNSWNKMIDLLPSQNNKTISESSYLPSSRTKYTTYGPSLPFTVDPNKPTKSLLRISVEEESMEIICFAKNKIGRMRVPCSYKLIVIGEWWNTVIHCIHNWNVPYNSRANDL